MKNRALLTAGLLATTLILGGCAVSPPSAPRYYETVRVAPPPPYVEYVGAPPVVGHVWITGYWNWGGTRHVWVPGRWEAPRPGYTWVPHRWERSGDHWRQHGGQWERHGGHDHGRQTHAQPAPSPQVRHEAPRGAAVIERRPEAPRHDRSEQRHERRDEVRPPEMRPQQRAEPMRPVERHDDHRSAREAREVRSVPPAMERVERPERVDRAPAMPVAPVARVEPRHEQHAKPAQAAPSTPSVQPAPVIQQRERTAHQDERQERRRGRGDDPGNREERR